jgi:hypothetical protein
LEDYVLLSLSVILGLCAPFRFSVNPYITLEENRIIFLICTIFKQLFSLSKSFGIYAQDQGPLKEGQNQIQTLPHFSLWTYAP